MPRPDACEGQIVGQCAALGQRDDKPTMASQKQKQHKQQAKVAQRRCACVQTLWHSEIRAARGTKQKPAAAQVRKKNTLSGGSLKQKQANQSVSVTLQNIYSPDKLKLVPLWTRHTALVAAEGYQRSSPHRLGRRGEGAGRGGDAGRLTTML